MIKIANIKKKEPFDLYIGRQNKWLNLEGSKWANPFPMKNEGMRQEVLNNYENYIIDTPELFWALNELEGLTLGCYCSPKKCHGDVLIYLNNIRNWWVNLHHGYKSELILKFLDWPVSIADITPRQILKISYRCINI